MKPLDCIVAHVRDHYPSMHSSLTSTVCVWGWGPIFEKTQTFPFLLIYFRFPLSPISLPFVSLSSLQVIMCKVLTGPGGAWSMES